MKNKVKSKDEPILIEEKGHLHIYRYPNTGEEICIHVLKKENMPEIDIIEEYEVIVVWHKNMSKIKQIVLLRRLFPSLNNISSLELLDKARNTKEFVVGAFLRWEALNVVEEGRMLGLEIYVKEQV